jgi:hypothetical protein
MLASDVDFFNLPEPNPAEQENAPKAATPSKANPPKPVNPLIPKIRTITEARLDHLAKIPR